MDIKKSNWLLRIGKKKKLITENWVPPFRSSNYLDPEKVE